MEAEALVTQMSFYWVGPSVWLPLLNALLTPNKTRNMAGFQMSGGCVTVPGPCLPLSAWAQMCPPCHRLTLELMDCMALGVPVASSSQLLSGAVKRLSSSSSSSSLLLLWGMARDLIDIVSRADYKAELLCTVLVRPSDFFLCIAMLPASKAVRGAHAYRFIDKIVAFWCLFRVMKASTHRRWSHTYFCGHVLRSWNRARRNDKSTQCDLTHLS